MTPLVSNLWSQYIPVNLTFSHTHRMHTRDIMTKDVISVTIDTSVSEAANLLFDHNLTGMPVVDEDRHVIGMITEYDLLSRGEHIHIPSYMKLLSAFKIAGDKRAIKQEIDKILSLKASDIMTHPVVTVSPDTEVTEAARIFADEHINPLPVVDEHGILVGIVSRADIVKLFKKARAE